MKAFIDKLFKRNKWKLYLYYKNQCIKKLYIDEDFAPMDNLYVIDIIGKKHLIGTNKRTKMIFQSYKYKYTDKTKKEAHIEVIEFEGVDTR